VTAPVHELAKNRLFRNSASPLYRYSPRVFRTDRPRIDEKARACGEERSGIDFAEADFDSEKKQKKKE
jgi:hypothetical protein